MPVLNFLTSSTGVTLIIAFFAAVWTVWQARQPKRWLENIKSAAETLEALPASSAARGVVERRLEIEAEYLQRRNKAADLSTQDRRKRFWRVVIALLVPIAVGLVVLAIFSIVSGGVPLDASKYLGLLAGGVGGVAALSTAWRGISDGISARAELDELGKLDLVKIYEDALKADDEADGPRDEAVQPPSA